MPGDLERAVGELSGQVKRLVDVLSRQEDRMDKTRDELSGMVSEVGHIKEALRACNLAERDVTKELSDRVNELSGKVKELSGRVSNVSGSVRDSKAKTWDILKIVLSSLIPAAISAVITAYVFMRNNGGS